MTVMPRSCRDCMAPMQPCRFHFPTPNQTKSPETKNTWDPRRVNELKSWSPLVDDGWLGEDLTNQGKITQMIHQSCWDVVNKGQRSRLSCLRFFGWTPSSPSGSRDERFRQESWPLKVFLFFDIIWDYWLLYWNWCVLSDRHNAAVWEAVNDPKRCSRVLVLLTCSHSWLGWTPPTK